MKIGIILAMSLIVTGAPLSAQTEELVTFDALMNDEAEMAGVTIRINVVLKGVHGLPTNAVRSDVWSRPVALYVTVSDKSSRRPGTPLQDAFAKLKPGTPVTLVGTCEAFKAGRFALRIEAVPEIRWTVERSVFPSRSWIDCRL